MNISQHAIAERLGISISTVSLALRGAPQVAEETRQQVLATADELGYKLRARRSSRGPALPAQIGTLTVLMRFEPTNSFYAGVLSGAESECRQRHISLRYSLLGELSARALQQYEETDALLLVGAIEEEPILRLRELGRPMVLVDNNLPHLALDRVLTENVGGVFRAVQHLIGLGHRHIAFLRGKPGDPSMDDRLAGYRSAIARFGLEPLEIGFGGPDLPQDAEQSMAVWLTTPAAEGCTAVVAYNDDAAIGVLHALSDHGLSVPDDVSIVGFDDIDMARIIRPALTTCQVERERLGALGIRALLARAADPHAPTQALVQDVTFIERASTRRL